MTTSLVTLVMTATKEIRMSKEYFGCEGCGQEGGTEGENNWCRRCESYKYFGWMTEEVTNEG